MRDTYDSFMMLAIFSSLAFNPWTKFFSKLLIPSLKILMLCNKFLMTNGLKTFNSN